MTKQTLSLIEATHANHHGYSDVTPYEIVRVISDKTIEIRRMSVEKDPSWKPEIIPGGFAGHCVNQNQQTWIFHQNENFPVIRARLQKNGDWKSAYGRHVLAAKPRYFYDYNF